MYFIKRYQNTKSATLKSNYKNYITQVIFFIENQRINKTFESQQTKDNTFDIHTVLTNTVNFLLVLQQEKTFDSIVNPLLTYYTQLLLERVLKDEYSKTETVLCLWKAGNKLRKNHIKEKATAILDENCFDEKSAVLKDIYKRYQAYAYIYEETQKESFGKLRDSYLHKFNTTLETYQLNDHSVSLWNGSVNIGLSIITLENKFPTNWDECL
jgi:hypothetical protein